MILKSVCGGRGEDIVLSHFFYSLLKHRNIICVRYKMTQRWESLQLGVTCFLALKSGIWKAVVVSAFPEDCEICIQELCLCLVCPLAITVASFLLPISIELSQSWVHACCGGLVFNWKFITLEFHLYFTQKWEEVDQKHCRIIVWEWTEWQSFWRKARNVPENTMQMFLSGANKSL